MIDHIHIIESEQMLIRTHYSIIHLQFTAKTYAISWIALERCIITGCTIYDRILFVGMNLMKQEGQKRCQRYAYKQKRDLTDTSNKCPGKMETGIPGETVKRSIMKSKPMKFRSLVMRNVRDTSQCVIQIQDEEDTVLSMGNGILWTKKLWSVLHPSLKKR
ncbi:hypothetical protein CHS0354_004004 [Potamilus streckersoni]|uniref:Uncharacterized protein n=1 Tax=Potamilus streckersoni TaxID=2493646 RepID=A0AAE0S0L5_9BIVA|nr:hypothetical protein CHS0354_004004 [Potamilus streckersoni]